MPSVDPEYEDQPVLPPVEGPVKIDKSIIRALLDAATGTPYFSSGFLCEEEVLAMRAAAEAIGVDPLLVTPSDRTCMFNPPHEWQWSESDYYQWGTPTDRWRCVKCGETTDARPDDWEPPSWWKPVSERKVIRTERRRVMATSTIYHNGEPVTEIEYQILEPLERPKSALEV